YIKGNGRATSKAWGGNKDVVYSDLIQYADQPFEIHLTERVGVNTWHRGTLDGKTVWLHANYLKSPTQIIVLDAGHGGRDPGSSGNDLIEKDINLDITLRTQRLLEQAGYYVIMTRT